MTSATNPAFVGKGVEIIARSFYKSKGSEWSGEKRDIWTLCKFSPMTFNADQSLSKISCKLRPGLFEVNQFAFFRRFICLSKLYQNTLAKPKSLPLPNKNQ